MVHYYVSTNRPLTASNLLPERSPRSPNFAPQRRDTKGKGWNAKGKPKEPRYLPRKTGSHLGERVPVTDSDTVFGRISRRRGISWFLNSRRFLSSRKLHSKYMQHSRHSRSPQDNAAPNACQQGCVWHGHPLDILTVILRDTQPSNGAPGRRVRSSYPWWFTRRAISIKGETHNITFIFYNIYFFGTLTWETIQFDLNIVSTGLKRPTSSRRNIRNIFLKKHYWRNVWFMLFPMVCCSRCSPILWTSKKWTGDLNCFLKEDQGKKQWPAGMVSISFGITETPSWGRYCILCTAYLFNASSQAIYLHKIPPNFSCWWFVPSICCRFNHMFVPFSSQYRQLCLKF